MTKDIEVTKEAKYYDTMNEAYEEVGEGQSKTGGGDVPFGPTLTEHRYAGSKAGAQQSLVSRIKPT